MFRFGTVVRSVLKVPMRPAQPLRTLFNTTKQQAASGGGGSAPLLEEQYSGLMKWLHWSMAGGVLTCIGTVTVARELKDPKEKGKLMRLHKSVAVLLMGGIAVRVGARLFSTIPKALPGPAVQKLAGTLSHGLFYGLMIFMPVSGITMGYFGGKGIPFFWTDIPGADEDSKDGALAKQAYINHKRAGEFLTYLVPLHVGAVGFHVLKGHKILARMNPFI